MGFSARRQIPSCQTLGVFPIELASKRDYIFRVSHEWPVGICITIMQPVLLRCLLRHKNRPSPLGLTQCCNETLGKIRLKIIQTFEKFFVARHYNEAPYFISFETMRNSSVPETCSHSNTTISVATTCTPFWRQRAMARA